MTTARLIREARRSAGLSQRALASRAGVAQPALADIERAIHDTRVGTAARLLRAAGCKLFVLPTTRTAASSWADTIHTQLRSTQRNESTAFRAVIGLSDDLAAAEPAERVALCLTPPAPCGDPRFDAAVAAVVEHHLTTDGLPVPDWVHEPWRSLSEPWEATPHLGGDEVPDAFLRHGVLLARSELASA